MKRTPFSSRVLPFLGVVAIVAFPLAARGGDSAAAKIIKEFDKNDNHRLDGEEIAAVQKAYEEKPNGPLKEFDKNKDGKLEEREVLEIKEPAPKLKKLKEIGVVLPQLLSFCREKTRSEGIGRKAIDRPASAATLRNLALDLTSKIFALSIFGLKMNLLPVGLAGWTRSPVHVSIAR